MPFGPGDKEALDLEKLLGRFALGEDRATPSADTASSTVPYASGPVSSLATRPLQEPGGAVIAPAVEIFTGRGVGTTANPGLAATRAVLPSPGLVATSRVLTNLGDRLAPQQRLEPQNGGGSNRQASCPSTVAASEVITAR